MEQLVLGFFQEQLSKVIIGFRKEQINANLLNGKGEIKDVSLNCSFINETVRKLTPLVEFEEIHVSRLGFNVSSWANLRKAPIVVDIGEITAVVHEPLQCLPKKERRRVRLVTERQLVQLLLEGVYKPFRGNGSYGFADRIVDNLTIEIETFRLSLQSWGKFKTRRVGPWTPPRFDVEILGVRIVAVDQYGHENTPDQVWAHNRQSNKFFLLHKKVSGEVNVNLVQLGHEGGDSAKTMKLITSTKFELQAAVKRRLRDGGILGIQMDFTIPTLHMDIDSSDIPVLAHFLATLKYCLVKDKSFEDPIRSQNATTPHHATDAKAPVLEKFASMDEDEMDEEEDAEDGDGEGLDETARSVDTNDEFRDDASTHSEEGTPDQDEQDATIPDTKRAQPLGSIDAPFKERPLVLLPNGIVIYENICVTCSVHNFKLHGKYGSGQDGYLQMMTKGCIGEIIWPKAEVKPGVYVQASVSYMSIEERMNNKTLTLMIGGIAHEDHQHSINSPLNKPREIHADENFPLFERRSIRDDPLDLRHSFPSQAFGAKTTLDLLQPYDDIQQVMVLHEMGVDEFDIILDTQAWGRALGFILHEDGGGYDERWHSGDWTDIFTPDMMKDPSSELDLQAHLQEAKQIFLDENFMISSDRFNVTARFTNIETRLPAAVKESVRSCDILNSFDELTIVVSSALPRTFLSGKIGNSIAGDAVKNKGEIDFPNDPSDIAYSLDNAEDPVLRLNGVRLSKSISTFRTQVTVKGFSIKLVPIIPFCNAAEAQELVAPMDLTMIACFEGEPPQEGSNAMKIALFVSVQVYRFHMNIDFDLLAGSTTTLLFHGENVRETIGKVAAFLPMPSATTEQESEKKKEDPRKVKRNLTGRRVMVKRHLVQSRETGGLGVVFCVQTAQSGFTIWRQNVPYFSPLRHEGNGYAVPDFIHDTHLPLIKLVETELEEFEVGIEFDFQANQSRRTVFKFCLEAGNVIVCDVKHAMAQDPKTGPGDTKSAQELFRMTQLVNFGVEKLPGNLNSSYSGENQLLAGRLEEQLKDGQRSWSLAADLNCPTMMNACIENLKDSCILLIEALLLPTGSKRRFELASGAPFPSDCIGAMFYSVFVPKDSPPTLRINWEQLTNSGNESSDPLVERTLRYLSKTLLPSDLQVLLLRLEVANLLIAVPDESQTSEKRSLGIHLMQSDLVIRFYPIPGFSSTEIEEILACKGIAWSNLIRTKEDGFYQSLQSRQSLLSIHTKGQESTVEELVHPFHVRLAYSAAEVLLAMEEDLKVQDVRKIESFIDGIKTLQTRSLQYQREIFAYISSIRQSAANEVSPATESIPRSEKSPKEFSDKIIDSGQMERVYDTIAHINNQFGQYQEVMKQRLDRKNAEISALKRKVFQKEKDRFAALALLSSRVAGWIRMGGVHKTGQRVARQSTLWPMWCVLRKELLFLYPRPGVPKPSDVVLLHGASIHQLSGGNRRQDLKRGFAITESGGVTRYFVAARADDYAMWIRELAGVVKNGAIMTNPPAGQHAGGTNDMPPADFQAESSDFSSEFGPNKSADSPESGRTRKFSNRLAGAKNRLGAALETARQKGKEISERRRDAQTKGDTTGGQENETLENSLLDGDLPASNPVVAEEMASGSDDVEGELIPRRLQLGKAFSGVGHATKNRLGSALQNARQRGAESARSSSSADNSQRAMGGFRSKMKSFARQDSTSSQADEVVTEATPWTCPACTFINEPSGPSIGKCEMCGTSRPVKGTADSGSREEGVAAESADVASLSAAEEQSTTQRMNRFTAIGAAVKGARQSANEDIEVGSDLAGRSAGSRFNRLRKGSSTVGSAPEESITIKRVHASSAVPKLLRHSEPLTLKGLVGKWMVSVKYHSASEIDLSCQEGLLDSNQTDSGNIEESGTAGASDPSNRESIHFRITTRRTDSATHQAVKTIASITEMVQLHTIVSEAVQGLLQQITPRGNDGQDVQYNWNVVDELLVSGRVLSGFLQLDDMRHIDGKSKDYQAEILESFLNSVLQCPMDVEALLHVAHTLGIEASTRDVTVTDGVIASSSDSRGVTFDTKEVDENNDDMAEPHRLLGLLASCEAQLRRVKSGTGQVRSGFDDNPQPLDSPTQETLVAVRSEVYDPLLPPTVSASLQRAMHEALVDAMAQRDEAHAEMIATNVAHVHELEQERRRNGRLRMEKEVKEELARLQQPTVGAFFQGLNDDRERKQLRVKLESFERILVARDGDEEMAEMCRQLSREISAKTSNALEISRLQESHSRERDNSSVEKKALEDELRRTRHLLQLEREKVENLTSSIENRNGGKLGK